jgi:diguanylate cyclase (GGDEF)-like protein
MVLGVVEDSDEDFAAFTRIVDHEAPEATVHRWMRAEGMLEWFDGGVDELPDLLVLDLNLPGIDGAELTRRLREDPSTVDLPIFVLSRSGLQSDVDRCYAAGADAYLTKPRSTPELRALLQMLMRSHASFRSPTAGGSTRIGATTAATQPSSPTATIEAHRLAYEQELGAERAARQRAEMLQRLASRLAEALSPTQMEAAIGRDLAAHGIAHGATLTLGAETTGGPTSVPVIGTRGTTLGTLRVDFPGEPDDALARAIAELTAGSLERLGRLARATRKNKVVQDDAPDLPSRRWWAAAVAAELSNARTSGAPLTLVLVEIVGFERYIQEYGHVAADRLLLTISDAWRRTGNDLLSRSGGESFAALLPGMRRSQAEALVTDIRRAPNLKRTFVAGVAEWDRAEDAAALVARAEAAMATRT